MGMSIKNAEVERLARTLADLRGTTMTEAIRQVLADAVERESPPQREWSDEKRLRIEAIVAKIAAMPRRTDLTPDEILDYDEYGIPGR